MRFLFGVIIGIALTLGAALLHDNNLPDPPVVRSEAELAQTRIVDWDVVAHVVKDQAAVVTGWWDRLMGRDGSAPRP